MRLKFLLASAVLSLTISLNATNRILIGAFDPVQWAGLTLTSEQRQGFGFYLEIEKNGQRASGYDVFHIIKKVGPNSGDGRYAQLVIDPTLPFGKGNDTPILDKSLPGDTVSWEWSAEGGQVVGRVTVNADVLVSIQFYTPWDYPEVHYRFDPSAQRIVARSGPLYFSFRSTPVGEIDFQSKTVRLRYRLARGTSILFSAVSGTQLFEKPFSSGRILDRLEEAERRYEQNRVQVQGENQSLVEAISNNLHWLVLLQPEIPAFYTPAGRRWIFPAPGDRRDQWTIFEWDSFFNALLLAVDSPQLASAAVSAVLHTQYDNGNIPNWRSRWAGSSDRAQPPVGAFAVLKIYQRFKDKRLLEWAYPPLKRFNLFWTEKTASGRPRRDGNENGLLEWGSDKDRIAPWTPEWEKNADGRTRAAWESGQDDLPNYDGVPYNENTGTLELDCVDLNSLFALDCECLSAMARILGKTEDERFFQERHNRIRRLMNEKMWNDASGTYMDLRWNGTFSDKLAASNFYPLVAGIPDARRAQRLLANLLDPQLFWGEYVVPTINRLDPAFATQQYWRGTIWPPINYLIYQGLRRYRFYQQAGELAAKSLHLFLPTWERFQLCRENYDSRTGEGGGQRYQSWDRCLP